MRRSSTSTEMRAVATSVARRRASALVELQPAVMATGARLRALALVVRRFGGHVVAANALSGTLTVRGPSAAVARIRQSPLVWSVQPSPPRRRLSGLDVATAAVGAPVFWAAGFCGGGFIGGSCTVPGVASADRVAVNVGILNDPIDESHPAFLSVAFEHPADYHDDPGIIGHGTEVASMIASQGVATCPPMYTCNSLDIQPTWRGVAYGVGHLLNAATGSPGGETGEAWALGLSQVNPADGRTLPGATHRAQVLNDSGGSPARDDDNLSSMSEDAISAQFGAVLTFPAGNDPSQPIADPCIAFDSICSGAIDPGNAGSADDQMASFSSRGPTPAGRKKPDLVAVGLSTAANASWNSGGDIWRSDSGTSFSAPQVAGAAALLIGSGITDHLAVKAILIDAARLGRTNFLAAMGTQTTWQPDWGWGELDLAQALAQRTNFDTRSIPGSSVRLYRATVATGDRATLVWDRRSMSCLEAGCFPAATKLTNLDLYQLDPATGVQRAQSASRIDNVEQVRSPVTGAAIYKVKASSAVAGVAAEPYALAGTHQVYLLANPQPAVGVSLSRNSVRQRRTLTVTATITNPSHDLSGQAAQASLVLPTGVSLTPSSGPAARALGTLAPGAKTTLTWRVRGTQDGPKSIVVSAGANRYGETFHGEASHSLLVDSRAPRLTVRGPHGRQHARRLHLRWRATDKGGVGVAYYQVQVSRDGRVFRPLFKHTHRKRLVFLARAGHSFRFRVRATDKLGNSSRWKRIGTVYVLR